MHHCEKRSKRACAAQPVQLDAERRRIDCAQTLSGEALFWDRTLDDWLAALTLGERERLINALYAVIKQMNIRYVDELTERWADLFEFARYAAQNMDEETKALYKKAFAAFADAVRRNIRSDLPEEFKEKLAQFEQNVTLLFEKMQLDAAPQAAWDQG